MFGNLFKSNVVKKSTGSDNFMQNLSNIKSKQNTEDVKSVSTPVHNTQPKTQEKNITDLSEDIKQQILDKSVKTVKTFASSNFLNVINEAKKENDTKKSDENISSKDEQFENLYNNGLYYIHEFAEKPENKENLKLALGFFADATTIKKNRAEPFYFLAYICYLVDDIPLAEKYFKITSYLNPQQKNLMSLGRKISNSKMNVRR